MRPGHLGDLQDCWFGSLEGQYFEILEARSADPIFLSRDRIGGKTGEEFKAYFRRGGPVTVSIPRSKIRSPYPYQNSSFPGRIEHLVDSYKQNNLIFKLSP